MPHQRSRHGRSPTAVQRKPKATVAMGKGDSVKFLPAHKECHSQGIQLAKRMEDGFWKDGSACKESSSDCPSGFPLIQPSNICHTLPSAVLHIQDKKGMQQGT